MIALRSSCSIAILLAFAITVDNWTTSNLFPKIFATIAGNKIHCSLVYSLWVSRPPLPRESFEDLAMPLFDRLYNFAHWLTQNREEAEDLLQETYAKALKGFSSFQPGTNFRAWMYRILRNTFLTSRTGLKSFESIDEAGDEVAGATEHTPETILLQRLDQDLVRRGMDELPVLYREVLLLYEVEEMSYQEISATLGVPIGTVMSRLSRARRALRENVQRLQGG
jgi:RNA polymerase sigma-70 factor (ECF subfamily)